MKVEYINPFVTASFDILKAVGNYNPVKGKLVLKNKPVPSYGVSVIVGVIGQVKGQIIYSMSEDTAKHIASTMMMGMPVDEFDELAQSAISELTNMLTANVATNFSNDGIIINISTPTLVHGKFTANATTDKVVCVEMDVDGMIIEVNISMEKNTL